MLNRHTPIQGKIFSSEQISIISVIDGIEDEGGHTDLEGVAERNYTVCCDFTHASEVG